MVSETVVTSATTELGWSTSDAVSVDELFTLALGTYEEKLPQAPPPVGQGVTAFWVLTDLGVSIPLVCEAYTTLRVGASANGKYARQMQSTTWQEQSVGYEAVGGCAWFEGQRMMVRTLATGATVGAVALRAGAPEPSVIHKIFSEDLVPPNSIPVPDYLPQGGTAPLGTPRFLVGVGKATGLAKGSTTQQVPVVVLHEQMWRPSPTSFAIAPGESKTILLTQETGVSDTSTEDTEFAESLGLSLSGGFGPISAALSASFSATQKYSHSRTLTSRTVSTSETVVENKSPSPELVVFWELVDIYTVVENQPIENGTTSPPSAKVRGTIECVAAPSVVRRYSAGEREPSGG